MTANDNILLPPNATRTFPRDHHRGLYEAPPQSHPTMGSVTPNGTDAAQQSLGAQPQTQTQTLPKPTKPLTARTPYGFLHNKLKRRMTNAEKTPLVLVACGSFSPISILHLQMFDMAERYATRETNFEVVGSYLSPVSDAYKKPSLVPAYHRLVMCSLAVEDTTDIMVDSWEALRHDEAGEPVYSTTIDALRHFDHEINEVLGGIQTPDGTYKKAQIVLLVGADVAVTMGDPKVWAPADILEILGTYGMFVVERPAQTDINEALKSLKQYENIWQVNSFENDVSSTRIRNQIKNGEDVFDLPPKVIDYIRSHGLYQHKPNGVPA
jgi:nicotinamide mononucleotide adenylyltransferase